MKARLDTRPFLKWAGGKRWFVKRHGTALPSQYRTYYEPFLGSGAVFFHLHPAKAVISDKNEDLISTYLALRDDWRAVLELLQRHQRHHSKDHYYRIRRSRPRSIAAKAARLIYLNRTCFNGLYRVNLRGEFNVPKGTKSAVLLADDDFAATAEMLKRCTILCGDFAPVINRAKKGDLIYADPPYTVQHNNNNFLKYNERIFSWSDQVRLADAALRASERGAKVVIANADHDCIRELYSSFSEHTTLTRASVLAADRTKRRATTELLVANFAINTM